MPAWLTSVKRALGAGPNAQERVYLLLKEAYRARTTLELEPLNQAGFHKLVLAATIEQVRDDDLIISQPLIGALNHPLATGEELLISFGVDSVGGVSGKTQALGRVQIPSGGAQLLFGYRLAMPAVLRADERRRHRRVTFGSGPAPAAALYPRSKDTPLRGIVLDISVGGMLIRILHKPESELALQQRVHLSVQLPPPVGVVDEDVTVVRIAPSANRTNNYVGVAFDGEVEGLADLVHRLEEGRHAPRAVG
ncbi:MAG: PilZ domain-containing protein [Phycisphaerales bacterium]